MEFRTQYNELTSLLQLSSNLSDDQIVQHSLPIGIRLKEKTQRLTNPFEFGIKTDSFKYYSAIKI